MAVHQLVEDQALPRKKRRLSDGVYVSGAVNGEPVLFTADTGASRTVLSTRLYERLGPHERPSLERSICLKGASGAPLKERGKANFTLRLGTLEIIVDAIVAEIEDDALLGYDVLNGSEKGPADILLSKNKIVLDGVDIPCFQVRANKRSRRVIVAEDTSIPGLTEALVDVYVERIEEDDEKVEDGYLVEPSGAFQDRYHLMMASTLVDINRATTCKVRILNPFSSEVTLKQDAEIGMAERIERLVSIVAEEENSEENENLQSIRKINVNPNRAVTPDLTFDKAKAEDVPEHLKVLFTRSTEGMPDAECQVVAGLLVKYQNTFSRNEWDLGLTHLAEHPINTGDAYPVKQRPRRVPLAYAQEEKQAIEDLLKKGVIQKSTSPWASPIVLVKKKNGSVRPCVDYRRVNALVKPDGFPLPRVQDCLDAVAGSTLFSSFDLTSGYFQIPLKTQDIPKSAFCCKYGQFEMTRMPFGLNNAASTFQRTMELALQGLQWVTCLVYIDDIITYGRNFTEHIQRVDEVLNRIKQAALKLKPEKCNLFQTRVTFLGHVVSDKGVSPDPNNVAKIVQWPTPQNAKQVKQFVATGSYYRRFVKDFAKIARPLTELTKLDKEFIWDSECDMSFEKIKQALISPEVMGYPNNHGSFYLDVDASGYGLGGVLAQMQEGREKVIAYASRSMNKAEKNYCVTEQELLAVIFFTQYFRQYLLGRKFKVRTDHQALVWLFRLKEPSGKIARWLEILAQYDFEIEYRPGKKQGHCDALSRCPNPRDCTCADVDMSEPLKCGPCKKCQRRAETMMYGLQHEKEVTSTVMESNIDSIQNQVSTRALTAKEEQPGPSSGCTTPETFHELRSKGNWLNGATRADIAILQSKDPDIALIFQAKVANSRPSSTDMVGKSPAARHYWIIWDSLELKEGVLYKHFQKADETDNYWQLIVPAAIKRDVVQQMHSSITAGHLGVKKTKAKVNQGYYWYNLKEDIGLYIKSCDVCESDKKPNKKPKAPLGSLLTGAPWDVLALDFTGPFPLTARGNRYILVITDHFTKYVEVIAVPNQTAEECASRIINDVISRWGTPLAIHSDQGSAFESRLFKDLCHMLEVKKTRTSARNPRGNGQAERFMRTLVKMIKAYLVGEQEDWDLHLGCIAGAYRSTPNEGTRLTPNMLNIGRETRMPADLVFNHYSDAGAVSSNYGDYAQSLRNRMLKAHEVARKHLERRSKRSKEIYDSKMSFHQYNIGDIVWCLHETKKVGICPKLEKCFDGPFIIHKKYSDLNFVIQLNANGQERVVHHNKLKSYAGEDIPSWILKARKHLKLKKT